MAKLIFEKFSIDVKESIEELKQKALDRVFIEVTETHDDWMNIPDRVVLVNAEQIIIIRD